MDIIKKKNLYCIILFIPVFLLSAFRNGLGTDYIHYVEGFNDQSTFGSLSFLFKLFFVDVLRIITSDSIIFFIVTAFITNYFILKMIYDESSIIYVSVIIYIFFFYLSTYNLVRQFLALSIFFYFGLKLIQENKKLYYIIFLLLLAQIHFSVYFLILFLLFKDEKKSIYFYLTLWGISLIFVLFKNLQVNILQLLLTFFAKLPFAPAGILDYSNNFTVFLILDKSNLQLIVKNLVLLILFFSFNKFEEKKIILYFNLFFFGIITGNLLNVFDQIGPRLAFYGEFALIIFIPEYIKLYHYNKKRVILCLWLLFFISYGLYRFWYAGESEALPYNWIVNPVFN